MLEDLLKSKKCFKLVCGAGNENEAEVEKLVALYSLAGCNFFDLCAKPEILEAAKRGLSYSIPQNERGNFYFCVSVGIKGDPHVSKAIVASDKCISCGNCARVCLQRAVSLEKKSSIVDKSKCIGCAKCINVCNLKCISLVSENKDLNEVLPPLIENGVDCIELHAMGEDEAEVDEKWSDINKNFDGILSLCVGRTKLGNDKVLERIKRLLGERKSYSTIIQADGTPMSGGSDDFETTAEAISTAKLIQGEKLPVFLIPSGGTNSKTTELANICGVSLNGVAIGTFAREIVREYLQRDDFLQNREVFNKALTIAKNLVDTSLKFLS